MFFPGSPLNYPANSLSSIRRYEAARAPTTFDFKNFNIGDEWLDTSESDPLLRTWFKLVSKENGAAFWCDIFSTGAVVDFLVDQGVSPVEPDAAGQITLTGTNGIVTIGSLNTVTFDFTGGFICPGSTVEFQLDCTDECLKFRGIDVGFTGTDWTTCQAGIQTLDAVATAIDTITLSDTTMVTVKATFSGARADHTAALAGDIVYGARRSGGGAVEMSPPVINIMDDGAASVDIDADVSGNDIRLLVTGEAATTWNWVVTYEFQILTTNA